MNKETKTNETKYDYRLFTAEDERMYRDFLESQPYDPELAKFFHEEYKKEVGEKNYRRRHLSDTEVESLTICEYDYCCISDIFRNQQHNLCKTLFSLLNQKEKKVVACVVINGKSKLQTSRFLGIHRNSVEFILNKALEKMRNYAVENGITKSDVF